MLISLGELIKLSDKYLSLRGVKEARRDAEDLIANVLGIKRLDLYFQINRLIQINELALISNMLYRRGKREPMAYIMGHVPFADLSIKVTSDVLVPRPETEILVEKICQKLALVDVKHKILWDVCCGSGCIGLAIKAQFPQLEVILSDLSDKALNVAEQNAHSKVVFKKGDLFSPFNGMQCDFFVCNPPYITEADYESLEPEVHSEPKMALVSGKNGFEFYQRIAKELKKHLKVGGLGWLELGTAQGSTVQTLFESEGWHCYYEADWSGHDRFFFIENF